MVRVVLPWPPAALSPNHGNRNWWAKSKAAKSYRDVCYLSVLEQRVRVPRGERFDLLMAFVPPRDERKRDRDNLVAQMKAGIDGLARAWGIDDSSFVRLTAEVVEEVDGEPRVVLWVTEHVKHNPAAGTPPTATTE